jgi:hypothetical protein
MRLKNTDAIMIDEAIPTFFNNEVSVIINSINPYHKEYIKKSNLPYKNMTKTV